LLPSITSHAKKYCNIHLLCKQVKVNLGSSPYILYSDGKGNISEDQTLYATGRSGWDALPIPTDEWIPLPDGGQLYELPGRRGIGIDVKQVRCVFAKKAGLLLHLFRQRIQGFI
jgi:hypothetical protein